MVRRPNADELLVRAEANGYKRGAHGEDDKVRHREKYVPRILKNQDETLDHYVTYVKLPFYLAIWRDAQALTLL